MTITPPTPEKRSPEALAAARQAFLDTGVRWAVLRSGQRMRFLTVEEVALALDRFAAARVEAERERLKNIIDIRLNNNLVEMQPNYDDSIIGFNEAWDIVQGVFNGERT